MGRTDRVTSIRSRTMIHIAESRVHLSNVGTFKYIINYNYNVQSSHRPQNMKRLIARTQARGLRTPTQLVTHS